MPKQLNVNLAFTADTSAAKRQIQELQNSLTQLVNGTKTSGNKLGITKDINDAIRAAAELKVHLQNAINTNTGNLDFSRLSESLKKSGTDLNVYGQKLRSLGPEGQQAFQQLAKSVAQSEIPLRRSTALLDQFKTTLMNTARWQISSSILHGFMGALQGAYGYAQNLNESLNNIRIVTGASVEEMSAFAENANRAAQSLSTTTTQYTDAALIYYQQGIRDQEEIAGRVESTIKLANVSRQSAEEVSDQLTAIWNNFYDGSKSLEYYADVITALGAATASSSEEISTGLQKFAAVADTVGLSYEYATSALATITATTRQSADTVGTGLRTLFTRLQGLKLGETLEDGVDLNKYSKALETVGVQILDVNGEMKDMDTILDELGQRWGDLSDAQKTALAQTVGGVRQYTNLIALMDNWDFMQENLTVAKGSEGTLQEQADIYAESWEAAQKRVRAAAEAIYDELLDDKFFIGLTNTLADVIGKIDDVIQALGGLPGVLSLIGSLVTKVFHDQMAEALTSAAYSLKMMTKSGREEVQKERTNFIKNAADAYGNEAGGDYTEEGKTRNATMRQELELQADLTEKASAMSDMELKVNQQLLDRLGILREIAVAKARDLDQAKEALSNASMQARIEAIQYGKKANNTDEDTNLNKVIQKQKELRSAIENQFKIDKINIPIEFDETKTVNEVSEMKQQLLAVLNNMDFDLFGADNKADLEAYKTELETLNPSLEELSEKTTKIKAILTGVEDGVKADLAAAGLSESTINKLNDSYQNHVEAVDEATESQEKFKDGVDNTNDSIDKSKGNIKTWADGLVNAANLAMNVAMSISMIKGAIDTIQDPDASPLDKLTSILMALGMVIPSILPSISALIVEEEALGAAGAKAGMGLTISSKGVAMFGGAIKLAFPEVLAIVVAIGALVAIISVLVDEYNKDAKAAKQAAEAAEKLADAEQEATQAADSLRSSIDKYDSCVEKLNQCTKGTQEWKEALKETGRAAVETLSQVKGFLNADDYAQLLKTYKETGQLDQQILENAQAQADIMADQASYAKAIGDYSATEMKVNSEQTDLSRSMNWAGMNVDDSFIKDNMDKLADALDAEDLKNKLRALGVNVSNLKDEDLANWQEQINSMSESLEVATGQLNLFSQMKIDEILGDAYSDAAKAYAASQQNSFNIDAQNKWMDRMTGSGINKFSGQSNETYQDILKALNDAGYNLSADSNAVRGNDNNRSFGFRDAEGKEVEYSAEYVASLLAASEATDGMTASADEAAETLSGIKDVAGQDFASSLMKNFDSANNEFDLSEYVKQFTGSELDQFKSLSTEDLLEIIGLTPDQLDQIAALYGQSGDDIIAELTASLTNASDHFSTIGDDLVADIFQKPFHELANDPNLTAKGREILAQNLHDALEQGGEEGVQELLSSYQAFTAAGGNLNLELTKGNELFNKFASQFETLDFNGITEKTKSLHAILDKVNEVGDTITAEEWNQLSEEAKEFFTINNEGEYELIGNAQAFKDIIESTDVERLKGLSGDLMNREDALSNAQHMTENGTNLNEAASLETDSETGAWSVNTDQVQAQIDVMRAYREELGLSEQDLNNWENALIKHNATTEEAKGYLEEMEDALGGVDLSMAALESRAEANAAQWQQVSDALAMSATDFDDLQEMLEAGEISTDSFNKKWEQLQNDLGEGIDVDELEDMADYLEENADQIDNVSDQLKVNRKAVRNVAKEIARFDRGIQDVSENMETWQEQLESGDIQEQSKAVKGLRKSFGDLLDVTGDSLSDNFVTSAKNMELMQRAAEGDTEAYDQLMQNMQSDIIAQVGMNDEEFHAKFGEIENKILTGIDDLEIGAYVDDAQAIQAMNELINAAGMTAEQATSYLASMGVDAEVETTTVPKEKKEEFVNAVPEISYESAEAPTLVNGEIENTTIQVPKITYSGDVSSETAEGEDVATALRVTSAQKSSGGGFKFNNSTHGGGSGGGGRRGGGGGRRRGGGGRTRAIRRETARKEAHKPREEGERYHVIKNQLETLEKQYDKINTAYERAFGANKLALLDKQIKKQDELIKAQKKYVKEISDNLTKDRKNLQNKGKKQYWSETDQKMKTVDTSAKGYLGMDVKLDKNGDITNYDALMKEAEKRYNAKVDEYNRREEDLVKQLNKTSDEDAREKINKKREELKRIMEEADAQYEGFIENLEQYEETYDLLLEEQQRQQEMLNEKFDMMLEKTDLAVTLKVDVSDDALKVLDFMLERVSEDAYKAAERIGLLGQKADESFSKLDAYKEGMVGILNNHGLNGEKLVNKMIKGTADPQKIMQQLTSGENTLTDKEVETMRKYVDGLLEEAANLAEYRLQVVDEIGVVMEANMDQLDRMADKMDHLKTVSQSYKNIVDLTGRSYLKMSSAIYDQMEKTNVELSQQSLSMAKQSMEYAQSQLTQLQQQYDKEKKKLSEEEKYHYEQLIKQAEDYVQETTENYYSSWEEALEAVNTRHESMIKNLSEDFSKAMGGNAGNLEGLKEQLDLQKKIRDVYVPEYEKVYQLTKLTRDAQKQIDETNNVKVKRELQKVQEKILAAQKEGNKLSQYDIDYLQKELELKAAQMALEEAAQVKSQVRMTRDSEGNYSYVYTADNKAVEEAEDNYTNKLYEMQKLNEEYIGNLEDQMLQLQTDFINAMQEAENIYGLGTKEYYDAIAQINQDYNTYFQELNSQMGNALANQQTTANEHAKLYVEMTGDVAQAEVKLTTSWDQTMTAAATGYTTLTGYATTFQTETQKMYEGVRNAASTWQTGMQDVYKLAGENIKTFGEGAKGDLNGVEKALGKIKDKAAVLDEQLNGKDGKSGIMGNIKTAFSDTLAAVKVWEDEYSKKIQKAIDKNKDLAKSINEVIKAASTTTTTTTSTKDPATIAAENNQKVNNEKTKNNGGDIGKVTPKGKNGSYHRVKAVYDLINTGKVGNEPYRTPNLKKKGYSSTEIKAGQRAINLAYGGMSIKKAINKALSEYAGKFDTGGYTGKWNNSEGRLALLHQKELVLNAKDTENMLAMVQMVREIARTIDINAMSAGSGFSALSAPGVSSAGSVLDQNVHITAEFPNATNRQEILAAFDNVINLASQYANRK